MKQTITLILFFSVVLLTVSCSNDQVTTPGPPQVTLNISSIVPDVAAVGCESLDAEITGTGFTASASVDLGADIKVISAEVRDAQHIEVTIKVADTAVPGRRSLVITEAGKTAQLPDSFRIEKNSIPVASFTVDPPSGTQNTTFTFDASASKDREGPIERYQWEFGDGDTANGVHVKHKFGVEGDFRAALTVIDSDNAQSSEHKKVQVRFFDRDQAINDISDVCVHFLVLFGQIETLSAEQIVVGFSTSEGCHGRAHEINIINNQKPTIADAHVDPFAPATVTYVDEKTAKAFLTGHFWGTYTDGSPYDGIATHDFDLVNDPEGWRICNFTLEK